MHNNERSHPGPLYRSPRFFMSFKLEFTPMKEGTPPPCTETFGFSCLSNWNQPQLKKAPLPLVPKPTVFHVFQIGMHPNARRRLFPLYRSPRFFTPFQLECTPMIKDTLPPCTEAPDFSCLSNWSAPQLKKAPLPLVPKPPVFHVFETGIDPNEKRHPSPLYRSRWFFTPSKLECTPMIEVTPPPYTEASGFSRLSIGMHPNAFSPYIEAPGFSRLSNWNAFTKTEHNRGTG